MARKIIVSMDFLDEKLKERVAEASRKLGFEPVFYDKAKDIGPEIADAEILFGSNMQDYLKEASSMKWFCNTYAGCERYMNPGVWPKQECLFTNSSGAYGLGISEHIVMVLLMMLRRMPEYQRDLAEKKWTFYEPIRSVHGLKVTILGTGDIGTHTARSLTAMGAEVRGIRRDVTKKSDSAFKEIWATEDIDKILPDTDALIMAVPSTSETTHIIDRERMNLLPKGAYIINVGRGAALDQKALIDALNSEHLAGAALDVMIPEPLPADHPLWNAKNILLTPHCSGDTALYYAKEKVVDMFLENLELYAAGKPMKRMVDLKQGY
ncbi:MAG: D-2-hydroxyacid dehydrogenase [Firmicutes bacterium]|nr:D-2-hydroxyacid dehydrogenase [Bacillota bacterium]